MSLLDRFRIDGQLAVVTGATRGIGRAIALGLRDAGARVVVSSRDEARCQEVAASLGGESIPCDVTNPSDIDALFEGAASLGGCRLFVHCAGVAGAESASEVSREALQRMLDVHYLAGVHASQRAAEQMRAHGGGAILLVSSVWGLGGASGTLAYGAAKAALTQAARVLALEWAGDGIRVNTLAPGFVDTDMTSVLDDSTRAQLVRRIPLRRMAEPAEMVGPALLALTPAGSYLSGQTLIVDGGERAR